MATRQNKVIQLCEVMCISRHLLKHDSVCVRVFVLTSSASSPGRGCGSAGPPGEVWYPAVQLSAAGLSSSAAGCFAGTPRYRPAGR